MLNQDSALIAELEGNDNDKIFFDPYDRRSRQHKRSIFIKNCSPKPVSVGVMLKLDDQHENYHNWYSLTSETTNLDGFGKRKITITIEEYPLQHYRRKLPISIEVYSIEDSEDTEEIKRDSIKVTLTCDIDVLSFRIDSEQETVKGYPSQTLSIPIRIDNPSRVNDSSVDVSLKQRDVKLPNWLKPNQKDSIRLTGLEEQEASVFEIQIPDIKHEEAMAHRSYPFEVEMTDTKNKVKSRKQARLRIEPMGELKLKCSRPVQELPRLKGETDDQLTSSESNGTESDSSNETASETAEKRKKPSQKSKTVFYEVSVENASNLPQMVQLRLDRTDEQLQEAQERNVDVRFVTQSQNQSDEEKSDEMTSELIELAPGGEETLYLELSYEQKLRTGTLNFDVVAENVSEGEKRPWETSRLPLTLQINVPSLGLSGLLFFLVFFLFLWAGWRWVRYVFRGQHQYRMTAVALQGTNRVWTGAGEWQDGEGGERGEVFGWDINRYWLMNQVRGWEGSYLTDHQLTKLSQVRVIRPGLSESASGSMAVGLSNGDIYTFPPNQSEGASHLNRDESGDNIFDLDWSSENVLFSAHGSGQIRRWDVTEESQEDFYNTDNNRPVYSIANVQGDDSVSRWLLFGLERNQFGIWMWRDDPQKVVTMALPSRGETTESTFSPIYSQEDFLSSFAVAPNDNRLLMIGDTTGSVRLLDLEKLRECFEPIAGQSRQSLRSPALDRRFQSGQEQNRRWHWRESDIPEPFCSNDLIAYENREQHGGAAVRSVAIAEHDGCHYGASVGDDGTVALWLFRDRDVETGSLAPNPTRLGSVSRTGIGSVDIEIDADLNQVLIAVASDNRRVQIYRRGLKNNANCQ